MSIKAKTCPFCGISLENIPPSKVFYHVNNGCILSSENFSINDIEKWNTRKPMQDMVERLEEEKIADIASYDFYREKGNEKMQCSYAGKINAYKDAIEIVKGVMNERD